MSAQIPETMLLSDLLKATGYDCPDDLQGKTFDEATTGGDAKISTNTDKTVDVSTYTEPVEIEPAEGYDATKKVTLTLENIPGADIEVNKAATIDVSTYTEPVEITPTEGKDGMAKATVTLSNIPQVNNKLYAWKNSSYEDAIAYTLTDTPSTSNKAILDDGSAQMEIMPITAIGENTFTSNSIVWTRSSTDDVTM